MDIQRNGNTIHIKAGDKDNNIKVEQKGVLTEVTIDGEKEVVTGSNIVIDAGAGNDKIKVSNLPSGKSGAPQITIIGGEGYDYIDAPGSVKVIDDLSPLVSMLNDSVVTGYIKEIETVLSRGKDHLEIKDKDQIMGILNRSKDDGSLIELTKKLDKDKKLVPLYKNMGTLVNQGDTGAGMSAVLMLFTLGGSLIQEAKDNRAYEMKALLKEANVPESILKRLK